MKTQKFFTAVLISLFISSSVLADNFSMKEEAYIPDIPFNTELIFNKIIAGDTNEQLPQLCEEGYIDDIPFDTRAIVSQLCCEKAMQQTFEMEDEAYINDIPFDTRSVVLNALGHARSNTSRHKVIIVNATHSF